MGIAGMRYSEVRPCLIIADAQAKLNLLQALATWRMSHIYEQMNRRVRPEFVHDV